MESKLHMTKSVSPDEAKVDLEMHTCGLEFNFWTQAEGCRFSPPERSSFRMQHMCGLTAKKSEKNVNKTH